MISLIRLLRMLRNVRVEMAQSGFRTEDESLALEVKRAGTETVDFQSSITK